MITADEEKPRREKHEDGESETMMFLQSNISLFVIGNWD
jgi:hypothetical protein